jgi:hypothetical protein
MIPRPAKSPGSVLTTTLVILGLVGLMLGTYMTLVSRQNYLTMRSLSWASALPLAEAGIEEALAHLNCEPTNLTLSGWYCLGGRFVKLRTLGDGYVYSTISTNMPPTLLSIGFGPLPLGQGHLHRQVFVTTRPASAGHGLLAKGSIRLHNSVQVDSYDSSRTAGSTQGRYDPAKRRQYGRVVSLSSAKGVIDLNSARVYGSVAAGPEGTVAVGPTGSVGDFAWVNDPAHQGEIQWGHFDDDFGAYVPSVSPPFNGGYWTPGDGTVDGTNYSYVVGSGDYQMSSCKLVAGGAMIVTGKARLYVLGELSLSGDARIYLEPGATLELFVGGPAATIGGSGIINASGRTQSLTLYGLPTLTSLTLSGTSDFAGTIYAPQAQLNVQGTPNLAGTVVAGSIDCLGTTKFHCDEALPADNGSFRVASWEEL